MVTIYDVPADEFIDELAERLDEYLEEPEWSDFAKTSPGREFPPEQDGFWYIRGASLLRKIAMNGPVGVERLATEYGGTTAGSNRYRVAPTHRTDGSQKLIRTLLQQLEDADLVTKAPGDTGRIITPAGQSLLDQAASDVFDALDRPELERYR